MSQGKVSNGSFAFIKQIVLSTSDDAVVSLKLFHLFHLLARGLVPIGSIRDLRRAICDRFHDCGPGCLGKPIVFVAGVSPVERVVVPARVLQCFRFLCFTRIATNRQTVRRTR